MLGLAELRAAPGRVLRTTRRNIQSVGATGGVYKGQGLIQREVMTCAYKEFLVQNK